MLRRLKREVMGQLPSKRRQVVRLPAPESKDWPKGFRQGSEGALHTSKTFLSVIDRCFPHSLRG